MITLKKILVSLLVFSSFSQLFAARPRYEDDYLKMVSKKIARVKRLYSEELDCLSKNQVKLDDCISSVINNNYISETLVSSKVYAIVHVWGCAYNVFRVFSGIAAPLFIQPYFFVYLFNILNIKFNMFYRLKFNTICKLQFYCIIYFFLFVN